MNPSELERVILATRQGWKKEDSEIFFSRYGIELEFLESETIDLDKVSGSILIGFEVMNDEEGRRDSAKLLRSENRIYVGSKVARDPKNILVAFLGERRYLQELSNYPLEIYSEMRTLLAEHTAKSGDIKEYCKDEIEINYVPETQTEYRYWVEERRLDSVKIKSEKRPSFLYSHIKNYENDWSGAKRTEKDALEVIFEDGSFIDIKEK